MLYRKTMKKYASVVIGQQNENQLLLNAFTIGYNWAEMIIRVDKCKLFGITEAGSTSKQFIPKIFVNNELIPTAEKGKSFKYLDRYYNYDIDDEEHKKNILETARELLHEVDSLPLHAKNKILLYKSYVLSKLSWDFTISDTSVTWVNTNVDMNVHEYFRRWLEIPISGTLDICMLSKSKFGLDIFESRCCRMQNIS